MLDFKKIPALAGLVGSLALVASTASAAYALPAPIPAPIPAPVHGPTLERMPASSEHCQTDAQGNITCTYSNIYHTQNGVTRQSQSCGSNQKGPVTTSRTKGGSVFFQQGTAITCSNVQPSS